VTKKAGEKKKKQGKKLGRIVARKRRALTAMRWQEIGMERGMKKAQDTKKTKSERQEYGALTNTAMRWGEAGQGDEKSE